MPGRFKRLAEFYKHLRGQLADLLVLLVLARLFERLILDLDGAISAEDFVLFRRLLATPPRGGGHRRRG